MSPPSKFYGWLEGNSLTCWKGKSRNSTFTKSAGLPGFCQGLLKKLFKQKFDKLTSTVPKILLEELKSFTT